MKTLNTFEGEVDLEAAADVKMSPAVGIATLALNFALKYHDINTVQDGTLYQQYKLEGKNMSPLHLDAVFETAFAMERHLLASSERIAAIVVDALADMPEDDADNADRPGEEA